MQDQPGDSWRNDARCRGVGPSLFFPERGQTPRKAIELYCNYCPVSAECREYHAETNSMGGVWGGVLDGRALPLSESEITKIDRYSSSELAS